MKLNKALVSLLICLFLTLSAKAETMKFAYYDQYSPRSFMEDGKMKGILIDIINEAIVKRMGIEVKHEGFPWVRAQMMVEKGFSDAFITVPTPTRKAYTQVSKEPIIVFETFLATAADNPKKKRILSRIKSLDELKNYVFVDYYGNGFAEKKCSKRWKYTGSLTTHRSIVF